MIMVATVSPMRLNDMQQVYFIQPLIDEYDRLCQQSVIEGRKVEEVIKDSIYPYQKILEFVELYYSKTNVRIDGKNVRLDTPTFCLGLIMLNKLFFFR